MHTLSLIGLLERLYVQAHFGCHHNLVLGKSSIQWMQRPDIIIAVDRDPKPQLKQTIC